MINHIVGIEIGYSAKTIDALAQQLSENNEYIPLIKDVSNWKEKRGIYRVKVNARTDGLVFALMNGRYRDAIIKLVTDLKLIEYVSI